MRTLIVDDNPRGKLTISDERFELIRVCVRLKCGLEGARNVMIQILDSVEVVRLHLSSQILTERGQSVPRHRGSIW